MTERETVLLREFKEKLDKLMDFHMKIKSENKSLKAIILEKEECISNLRLQNEEILEKYEHLKMARSLTGNDNEAHEAKIKINRIVREIDQCIAMLNR